MRLVAEVAGLLLVGAFLYLLWWPLVLLFAGIALVAYANGEPKEPASTDAEAGDTHRTA